MTVHEYGVQIQALAAGVTVAAPVHTVLGKAGKAAHTMMSAYTDDGILFLQKGDLVNALASFGYAQGWLEGSVFLGLVSPSSSPIWTDMDQMLDPPLLFHLREKVHRYHHLLAEGIAAVEPAPDGESILREGSDEILARAESALRRGRELWLDGKLMDALRWFAYGHGWLDVGARTGLFRITGRRDLFTV
jgi:hypothetical protein